MTSANRLSKLPSGSAPGAQRDASANADLLASLRPLASVVRLRQNQRLLLEHNMSDTVYAVSSGVLTLQAAVACKHRFLLGIIYPGDIFQASCAPPLKEAGLRGATAAELWRLSLKSLQSYASGKPELYPVLERGLAHQHARRAMHIAVLGTLSSEQRIAALLIELALRLGVGGPGGIAIEAPLSRNDMADYLSLNADTLSRHMSRLRANGILAQSDRSRVIIQNWQELLRNCPIAEPLLALHGKAPGDALRR